MFNTFISNVKCKVKNMKLNMLITKLQFFTVTHFSTFVMLKYIGSYPCLDIGRCTVSGATWCVRFSGIKRFFFCRFQLRPYTFKAFKDLCASTHFGCCRELVGSDCQLCHVCSQSVCLSVCPSFCPLFRMEQLGTPWTDFQKKYI